MKVGVDVSATGTASAGVARYAYQLLHALQEHVPEHSYVALTNHRVIGSQALGASDDQNHVPTFPVLAVWTQLMMPKWLRRAKLDVSHFTNFLAPVHAPCPIVTTVHDMSVFVLPRFHPAKRVLLQRTLLPAVVRNASAVVTHSEFSKREIVRVLRIPASSVHVVNLAPSLEFRPRTDHTRLAAVAERFKVEPGFLLCAGTVEPRKNLIRVIEALHLLHRRGLDVCLVIAGGLGWKYRPLLARIDDLGLAKQVTFTGRISDSDIADLMGLASVVIYASLYEGFGLPIIEAMAVGTPVVTSRGGATEEVSGGAACLVDPRSVSDIADGVAAAMLDQNLRSDLREAGLRHAAQFTWGRTARETAAVYKAVAREVP